MAGSRLEKIGTIYTRTTGLLSSGALSWEDRPLWYDIYKAFPPKEEPRFDRPVPNLELKKIFYKEDKIRATFQKNNKHHIGATNMFNNDYKSLSQKFIEIYQKIEKQYDSEMSPEQIYKEAIDVLKHDRVGKTEDEDPITLSSVFKETHSKELNNKIKVDITDIFQK